jgi:hypothetical protein
MPGYFFFFFAYELTRDLLRSGPNQTKDDIGRASHENSSSRFVVGLVFDIYKATCWVVRKVFLLFKF